jgi:zinc protease
MKALLRNSAKCTNNFFLLFKFTLLWGAYSSSITVAQSGNVMTNELHVTHTELNHLTPVQKKVLDNGMTILVKESHQIPKVAIQIWYNVGSKDEELGEKGIAHLIEHMIFKGTKTLSESDINTIVHKLSGSCNAFTSFDYTGYLFNFPSQHWKESLPIIADCMVNCAFNDDMLNSEMKAVIQELKMYKDRYERAALEELISTIFSDHPYHYPIIGYKQDLWSVKGRDLHKFYKKHYHPGNATLVVVGDVQAQELFELAQEYFGDIAPDKNHAKKEYFFNQDIIAKSVTLYREISHPSLFYMFVVPGACKKQDISLETLEWIVGKGKSSRLYKKLVNETQLATDVSTGLWDLFDYSVFFIAIDPKDVESIDTIKTVVSDELLDLAAHGITDEELEGGYKKMQMSFYSLLEDLEDQAYALGHSFLATGDENYIFTALNRPLDDFKTEINNIVKEYLRPTVMHQAAVLPLPDQEKKVWKKLQQQSDEEDIAILTARKRTTEIEEPSYANGIQVKDPNSFVFPKAEDFVLPNGLKVFYYNNPEIPKINIVLEFKAKSYYDPVDKQGLYSFVAEMMSEGTKKYSGTEIADLIESRGMSLDIYPGGVLVSMLHDDFEYGLGILADLLINATFPKEEIEKIREQMLAVIKQYWDEPQSFIKQLVAQKIYKEHPYSKQAIGTKESIKSITRKDLIDFYKKYISPTGARMAIVGDLSGHNIRGAIENALGQWAATDIEKIHFPDLSKIIPEVIDYPINRDQVVLAMAQLSLERKSPEYDKYLLFDQIFGGGVLGSMSSRLFDLREHTGLFYTINGSLIAGANEQPGMFQVRTIVSLDRLEEAENAIKETINVVADTLTEEDLLQAKRAVINSLVDNFAANSAIASSFLFLDKYGFKSDYFDKRAAQLDAVTLDDVKNSIKDILNSDQLVTVRVGRV